MTSLNVETLWHMPKKEVVELVENGAFSNTTGKIRFYFPSFVYYKNKYYPSSHESFPSISVTGSSCALKCEHCNGRVLETMIPAMTPDILFDLCVNLRNGGAVGCLISGGCLPDGSVPLNKFMSVISRIKNELGLTIFVHSGVVDFSTAKRLKSTGIDAVLIDVIGSDQTIQEVYHLDITVEDYERSLRALHESDMPFIPHVLIGLHQGKLKGELQALKMIAKHLPSAVIAIAFMPIHGTPMEKVNPPEPENIARILASARLLMPETPIVLGCMRPKGEHRTRTDLLAVKAGVDAIAFPVEEAIQLAEFMNLKTSFSSFCCSQIFKDITVSF